VLKELMTNDGRVKERPLVRMHVNELWMQNTVKVKIHNMCAAARNIKWSVVLRGHPVAPP